MSEDFKKQLEKYKKERAEYLEGWQRSRAEFLNYKKEETERMSEILKYANESLILKILPILDNFELAEKNLSDPGISQIKTQFQNFLRGQGIEEIKTLNQKFNPDFHEAVEELENSGESGKIIEEVQKGYILKGKVIRPAKVKVTK